MNIYIYIYKFSLISNHWSAYLNHREILLHIIRVWLNKTKTNKGKNCDDGD